MYEGTGQRQENSNYGHCPEALHRKRLSRCFLCPDFKRGVATGTLFNYFSTKEYLINSFYFEVKGNLSHGIGKDLEAESTFQNKLKRYT